MNLIKQFKTISLLIVLIVFLSILSVFVKTFDARGLLTKSSIQEAIILTPTPTPTPMNPFINPESFSIPSSYMGYVVTKVAVPDLGKAVLRVGSKNVNLDGSEWAIKKSGVSDFEYSQVKPYLNSNIQSQLVKQGWVSNVVVDGQALNLNLLKVGDLNQGYLKNYNGKVQAAILEGGKDNLGNVSIKLFLSNVYDLSTLR
jgi:hypothetical protein